MEKKNSFRGENLIFLISQPRAGSTLLQRMLAGHPEIHTTSEPWFMLPALYALRTTGIEAEYDVKRAWIGSQEFYKTLPEGTEAYWEAVRLMSTHLYKRALVPSGKRFFFGQNSSLL